jgi:N utilization substance protein A
VKKSGTRVKIVLSRTSPEFVKALFEQIIPEIQDRTIEIRSVAREPGYRSKVAVSSIDSKVDAVGACVGVRGSRIKEVIDELNQERIDIVRWNDSMQVMIPNALQPAEVEDVQLYPRLNQAIVLVDEKNLSLAIGKRGQNVRLASKLVNWNIDVMTVEELTRDLEKAERYFSRIPNMTPEVMEILITEGFFTYASLSYLTAEDLAEMTGLDPEVADDMIEYAEDEARRIEREGEPEWANPPEPEPEPEPENQTTAEEGSGESQGEEQIVGFAEPEEATPPPPQTAESSPPPAEPTPIEGDINSLFAPEPIKEETKPENESGDQK